MTKSLLIAASFGLAAASVAQPMTFRIGAGNPTQQLAQVESATELETFTGRTDKVTGTLMFDPGKRTGSGRIVVDAKSIDTGIPLRNDHMQSGQWLGTEANPNITFETTRVQFVRGDQYRVTGRFTMKGVTKTVTTVATVRHQKATDATRKAGFKGDVLQVRANFTIKLSDYGITISGPATGKVANTVRIGLTVYGQSGS
jgi:polyisoprenoid-binding protein YceI